MAARLAPVVVGTPPTASLHALLPLLLLASLSGPTTTVDASPGCPSSVAPWALLEVHLPRPPSTDHLNPFSAAELGVVATVDCQSDCPPHWTPVPLRGFFSQNYTATEDASGDEVDHAVGDAAFVVRYRPTEPSGGRYSITAHAEVKGAPVSPPLVCNFTLSAATTDPPDPPGFIRVGPNAQYFVSSLASRGATLTNTTPTTTTTTGAKDFFGVGMNLAWTNASGVFAFESYFARLGARGANYVRVWLTDSWDDLFLETSLGNYSLVNAFHIDRVLEAAERHGIRVMMCTESFNLFCSRANAPCSWGKSVYNTANGGVISSADQFFVAPAARALYKQRLTYLVARYAHSTSVFAWEFFNEVDLTDGFNATVMVAWTKEMAAYVRGIDPYAHPISTSFCCHDVGEVYSLPEVDFAMTHTYGSHNATDLADNNQFWSVRQAAEYRKPTFVAEFGSSAKGATAQVDPTGIGLHNGMWATVASRGGFAAMTWWWDNWVDPDHLYPQFGGVAAVVGQVAWAAASWSPLPAPAAACTDEPPDPRYSCEQQRSWGKCDQGFMSGHCCKTCFNCSATCVGHAGLMVAPYARLLGIVGRGLPAGDPAAALLWLQNTNHTFTKQNATLAPADRAPLDWIPPFQLRVTLGGGAAGGAGMGGEARSFRYRWLNTTTGALLASGSTACQGAAGVEGEEDGEEGEDACTVHIAVPAFNTDIVALLDQA